MKFIASCIICSLILCSTQGRAHPPSTLSEPACAHYIGNAGIMVTSGETKVLFDAFYAEDYGQYALVPETTHQALIDAILPYNDVDALLISHVHGDHFSPVPTLEFLRANKTVHVYASQQVIDVLIEAGAEKSMNERLHAFTLSEGDPAQALQLGGLNIEAVRIPHTGGERTAMVENLAFRVSLDNDLTVLHLGDADPDEQLFAPHQSHWDAKQLDVAFPPYWFLGSDAGRLILKNHLKAHQSIGVHVPIVAKDQTDRWLTQYAADLFTSPGETRSLSEATGCILTAD